MWLSFLAGMAEGSEQVIRDRQQDQEERRSQLQQLADRNEKEAQAMQQLYQNNVAFVQRARNVGMTDRQISYALNSGMDGLPKAVVAMEEAKLTAGEYYNAELFYPVPESYKDTNVIVEDRFRGATSSVPEPQPEEDGIQFSLSRAFALGGTQAVDEEMKSIIDPNTGMTIYDQANFNPYDFYTSTSEGGTTVNPISVAADKFILDNEGRNALARDFRAQYSDSVRRINDDLRTRIETIQASGEFDIGEDAVGRTQQAIRDAEQEAQRQIAMVAMSIAREQSGTYLNYVDVMRPFFEQEGITAVLTMPMFDGIPDVNTRAMARSSRAKGMFTPPAQPTPNEAIADPVGAALAAAGDVPSATVPEASESAPAVETAPLPSTDAERVNVARSTRDPLGLGNDLVRDPATGLLVPESELNPLAQFITPGERTADLAGGVPATMTAPTGQSTPGVLMPDGSFYDTDSQATTSAEGVKEIITRKGVSVDLNIEGGNVAYDGSGQEGYAEALRDKLEEAESLEEAQDIGYDPDVDARLNDLYAQISILLDMVEDQQVKADIMRPFEEAQEGYVDYYFDMAQSLSPAFN